MDRRSAAVLTDESYIRTTRCSLPTGKEDAMQRFEVVFELAGKTLKDYLEENGIVMNSVFL